MFPQWVIFARTKEGGLTPVGLPQTAAWAFSPSQGVRGHQASWQPLSCSSSDSLLVLPLHGMAVVPFTEPERALEPHKDSVLYIFQYLIYNLKINMQKKWLTSQSSSHCLHFPSWSACFTSSLLSSDAQIPTNSKVGRNVVLTDLTTVVQLHVLAS